MTQPAQPDPQPTQPSPPPAPAPENHPGNGTGDLDRLQSALEAERRLREDTQKRLAALEKRHQTDAERAIEEARQAGREEAERAGALALAAAEFRFLATGRLADPEGALAMLDLTKLMTRGKPDRALIEAAVARLAGPPPAPGHVPPGPRDPQVPADGNAFLRERLGRARQQR